MVRDKSRVHLEDVTMSLGKFLSRLWQRKDLRRRPAARRAAPRLGVEYLEERLVPADTRFAVIGDFGQAGQPEKDVASLVKSWSPDFVIPPGDNNSPDGTAATLDANVGQYYHDFIGNYKGT